MSLKRRFYILNMTNYINIKTFYLGLLAGSSSPDYDSSKHAAVGLDLSLRIELLKQGCDGIKTTLVCPYVVDTGLFT